MLMESIRTTISAVYSETQRLSSPKVFSLQPDPATSFHSVLEISQYQSQGSEHGTQGSHCVPTSKPTHQGVLFLGWKSFTDKAPAQRIFFQSFPVSTVIPVQLHQQFCLWDISLIAGLGDMSFSVLTEGDRTHSSDDEDSLVKEGLSIKCFRSKRSVARFKHTEAPPHLDLLTKQVAVARQPRQQQGKLSSGSQLQVEGQSSQLHQASLRTTFAPAPLDFLLGSSLVTEDLTQWCSSPERETINNVRSAHLKR